MNELALAFYLFLLVALTAAVVKWLDRKDRP